MPDPAPRLPALSEAHVARIPPHAGAAPPPWGTPLSAEERLALARELLEGARGGPFWVLAYGSLIWKPAFEHVEGGGLPAGAAPSAWTCTTGAPRPRSRG